jgi:arylsulfatase A-like enzyme
MSAALSCDSRNTMDSQPNIVIIMADDLGYGDLSGYDAQLISTPNVDRLIHEGRKFTDAHSPSAVCTPTRYALLTGRYAWRGDLQSGVLPSTRPLLIEEGRITLPSFLKSRGYSTACIGKWHLGFGRTDPVDWNIPLTPGPRDVGFDYFFGLPSAADAPPFVYVEGTDVVDRQPGEIIELVDGVEVSGIQNFRRANEIGRRITDKAVEFIEDSIGRPFFLYFATSSVHLPIAPDAEFQGTSGAGPYGDFVHEFDWSVGRILDTLDANGLTENTLVIVTSDNGAWSFLGCEEGHRPNGTLRGGKGLLDEGGHRVPFIARWPGRIEPESESDALLSLVDLFSTIGAALGIRIPNDVAPDSTNRWYGFVDDPTRFPRPALETTIHQSWTGKFAIRANEWKYNPEQMPIEFTFRQNPDPDFPRGTECTTDEVVLDFEVSPEQLYNLDEDRSETTNLADVHRELADDLNSLLQDIIDDGE